MSVVRRGRLRVVGGGLSLVVLAALLSACSKDPAADTAATAFLDAWSSGRISDAAGLTESPNSTSATLTAVASALNGRPSVKVGKTTTTGDDATTTFTVTWKLGANWSYDSTLRLHRTGKKWTVRFTPEVVHPKLGVGQALKVARSMPPRAGLLYRDGSPLFAKVPVVTVGLEPDHVPDLPAVAAHLASALTKYGIVATEIVADAQKAKPNAFVPVVTLRMEDYLAVKGAIHELPGVTFPKGERLLAVDKTAAQPLLGKVGEATAEVLKESGSVYAAGDQLGTSGLQRALNTTLSGTPAYTVSTVDASGNVVDQLTTGKATPGTAVRTTLDPVVQKAADDALASVTANASIVAVRPSTGEILAVAQSGARTLENGLAGHYPAGSTFKIITTAALLDNRVTTPAGVVPCPGTTVAGGKNFQNYNKFSLGTVPLERAFAKSCNTTFAPLATKLPPGALQKAASSFGVGATWSLPVPSFSGSIPATTDATEIAEDAIGQGKVAVSPLTMALVAATVAHGRPPTPSLLIGAHGQTSPAPAAAPISGATIAALRAFTRAVVTSGTAAELKRIGGLAGKTGTAEYGNNKPPRTHSWFCGYQGDLAFAVLIEDGATNGGHPAVPIAGDFLRQLDSSR